MIKPFLKNKNGFAMTGNDSRNDSLQNLFMQLLQSLRFFSQYGNIVQRLRLIPGALCLLLCLAAQAAGAASPGPGEVGELWQGKVLTASFRVGMCFDSKGKARGVLLLRHRNGQQDAYHLYGTIRNNQFNLSHSSGHQFSGRLVGPEKMEGSVRLANGMKLNLEGARIQNASLAGDDCSPPAQ